MKYLILSLSTGGGHNAAAQATADALKRAGAEAEVYDCLGVISPFRSKLVCGGYLWLVKHIPSLFGILYNMSYHITSPRHNSIVYKINAANTSRLAEFIHSSQPDAILTTHIFAAQQLAYLKKHGKISHWTAGIITDYDVQPFWNETDLDVIFTPHESLNEGYRAVGVNKAELVATGIPVDPEISPAEDLAAAKRALGLDPAKKQVLVVGGSMGAGKLPATLQALLRSLDESIQIIVVCGSNKKLVRRFQRMRVPESRLKIEGFYKPLHKLMRACDLIISKPGGLSSSETFALNRPMIVTHPIQGVESNNADFMKDHGLAAVACTDEELIRLTNTLLNDNGAIQDMLNARKRVILSDASMRIAKEVLARTEKPVS